MKSQTLFALVIPVVWLALTGASAWGEQRYQVTALVLKTHPDRKRILASCKAIPGYVDDMIMSFGVRNANELKGIDPGMMVDLTWVVVPGDSHAENIHLHKNQDVDHPVVAGRSAMAEKRLTPASSVVHPIALGQTAIDFSLIDQDNTRVRLGQFAGKVVALTFICTSCPLSDYCQALSNNFGSLRSRFKGQMGKEIVLLSVTFDPTHDRPEALAAYSQRWDGNKRGWYFLTGSLTEIEQVSHSFGVNFWPDEGTVIRALHTFVIGRNGKIAADLEGNEFTSQQLGDFIWALSSTGEE